MAVKISFINEIAGLCDRLGADVVEVAHGMGLDPRIGAAFLKAGLGYGGSCFPKDTQALVQIASRVDYPMTILTASMEVNCRQRTGMVHRIKSALSGLEGKVIALLGLAFKPHTDDVREAPSLELIQAIINEGGRVRVYDPKAMENARKELMSDAEIPMGNVCFCNNAEETFQGADALVLATEWPEFATLPWGELVSTVGQPFLFDGRNFLHPAEMRRMGYIYFGVGKGS